MYTQNRNIVLASGSPRRKNYLERYNLEFCIRTADVDETAHPGENPLEYARRMAREKGEKVAANRSGDELVIAADTIVVLDSQILGKPECREDVLPMLQRLNGREHLVITSFFIFDGKSQQAIQSEVTTKVRFKQVTEDQLQAYASLDEPLDKAGAYSIQGVGTFLVGAIEGSYNNVVGLPIEALIAILIENDWLSVLKQS